MTLFACAVTAVSDERADQLLIVETQNGAGDPRGLIDLLHGKVAAWWIPDRVARVPAMPLAASGKIDKMQLRADYAAGAILTAQIAN